MLSSGKQVYNISFNIHIVIVADGEENLEIAIQNAELSTVDPVATNTAVTDIVSKQSSVLYPFCLSIHPSIHLFIRPFLYLSMHVCIIYLSIYLSIYNQDTQWCNEGRSN